MSVLGIEPDPGPWPGSTHEKFAVSARRPSERVCSSQEYQHAPPKATRSWARGLQASESPVKSEVSSTAKTTEPSVWPGPSWPRHQR